MGRPRNKILSIQVTKVQALSDTKEEAMVIQKHEDSSNNEEKRESKTENLESNLVFDPIKQLKAVTNIDEATFRLPHKELLSYAELASRLR